MEFVLFKIHLTISSFPRENQSTKIRVFNVISAFRFPLSLHFSNWNYRINFYLPTHQVCVLRTFTSQGNIYCSFAFTERKQGNKFKFNTAQNGVDRGDKGLKVMSQSWFLKIEFILMREKILINFFFCDVTFNPQPSSLRTFSTQKLFCTGTNHDKFSSINLKTWWTKN